MKNAKTLDEARTRNLKHFWPDKPCRNGHVRMIHSVNGGCLECRRVRKAAYRARLAAGQPIRPKRKSTKPVDSMPLTLRVAFDVVHMRPGSPRVQNLLGCAEDSARFFPESSFLDEVTQYMRVYPLDRATHKRIAAKVRKSFPTIADLREKERAQRRREERILVQRTYGARHRQKMREERLAA